MKIMIFLHGTLIMHKGALGHKREEIVKQVEENEPSVRNYKSYVPVGRAVEKLQKWKNQDAQIIYLSSHKSAKDLEKDKFVMKKYKFPKGLAYYRKPGQQYNDITEKVMPDILIEDNCESIGGKNEMTITYVKPELKKKIKSIIVKEFGGIDKLPDNIHKLK